MTHSPVRIIAAREAWLAAMAAYEAQRLEVNRLWLAYLELADPGRAPKIRRFLKHGEKDAAKPVDVLFPDTEVSLGRSIPRLQEPLHEPPHLQMASTPLSGDTDRNRPFE
jgi:hypothetical protein